VKYLSKTYPHYQWEQYKFNQKQKRSSQWWLYKTLKEILPSEVEVIEEYSHPSLKFETGSPICLDIFVPSLNLAFEYHGYQHYHHHKIFGEVKSRKERDNERHKACTSIGVTSISVPYWWKHDKESILELLYKSRADIVPDYTAIFM